MDFNDIVRRLSNVKYQIIRNVVAPSDRKAVEMAFSILRAALLYYPTIDDSNLPIEVLGCALDWSYGGNNTHSLSISKGSIVISQSLLETISQIDETLADALQLVVNINNDEPAPDSGYVFIDDETLYNDALDLALLINGGN